MLKRIAADELAAKAVLLGREEFVNRELEAFEYLAGISAGSADAADTVVGAVAAGQADVVSRHKQLDVALKTDDGELSKSDEQLVAVAVEDDIITFKAAADAGGDILDSAAAGVAAGIRGYDARVKQDRLNNFNNCGRLIAVGAELDVSAVFDEAGREDTRSAFAAKEHHAFVEHREAVNDTGTAHRASDLALDLVEEADVNGVEAAVELYPLYVDPHAEKLGGARFYGNNAAGVQEFLSFTAEIDADVTQAFLAAAGIIYLAGVNANRLAKAVSARGVIIVSAAHRAGAADFIRHINYLQKVYGE